jgi:WD40 repeat protein
MLFQRTHVTLFSLILCVVLTSAGFAGNRPAPAADTNNDFAVQLKIKFPRRKGEVSGLVLSPDSRFLVSVTGGQTTELWDTDSGKLIATLDGRAPLSDSRAVSGDAFSADSQTLITVSGKNAKLWGAADGKLKRVLSAHDRDILSVEFSPDGNTIATGSADGNVKLWDALTGEVRKTLGAFYVKKYPRWRVISREIAAIFAQVSISFSADGKNLLTVPYHHETKLWDVNTGATIALLGNNARGRFSPSGRFIFTQRADFTGSDLWEPASGNLLAKFEDGPAAFSPDEQWLGLVGYQGKTGLFNLNTMKLEKPLTLNLNDFETWTAFSPDSKTFALASGLYGHTVALVDTSKGTVVANIPIEAKQGFDFVSDYLKYWEKLSFDPHSRFLMGANQKQIRFWDPRSGATLNTIVDGREPAVISGNGKFVVTTDRDKKGLSLWQLKT